MPNCGLLLFAGLLRPGTVWQGNGRRYAGLGGIGRQVWAWTHDLMEVGSRQHGKSGPVYLSPVGFDHYTGPAPLADFPSGRYVWDWATDGLLDRLRRGELERQKIPPHSY